MKLNKYLYYAPIILFFTGFTACKHSETKSIADDDKISDTLNTLSSKDWAITGFERLVGVNPVLSPDEVSMFYSEMNNKEIAWESNDVFNPAAAVMGDSIYVLYRAEDKSGQGIGERTSRIGIAATSDGFTMKRGTKPVLYPKNDSQKEYEWPGGCEDPRVAVTENETYVMLYTQWNKKVPRLAVATSRDLRNWEKHGPAFAKAYNGKYLDTFSKSASIVTKITNDKQVITKVNGKYWANGLQDRQVYSKRAFTVLNLSYPG